jgi:uncharacterized protein YodC (DUF2158 family)
MNAGDVVVLKSGSPELTIMYLFEDSARCVWYSENEDKFKVENFPLYVIKIIEE